MRERETYRIRLSEVPFPINRWLMSLTHDHTDIKSRDAHYYYAYHNNTFFPYEQDIIVQWETIIIPEWMGGGHEISNNGLSKYLWLDSMFELEILFFLFREIIENYGLIKHTTIRSWAFSLQYQFNSDTIPTAFIRQFWTYWVLKVLTQLLRFICHNSL